LSNMVGFALITHQPKSASLARDLVSVACAHTSRLQHSLKTGC
jgi:hypothetical protein